MCGDKSDAVNFLKSSIARYGEQLDELQRQLSDSALATLPSGCRRSCSTSQVSGLIEDAARLLSQLWRAR